MRLGRTLLPGLIVLVLACWANIAAASEDTFAHGILFEIGTDVGAETGAGGQSPCYLFGTIHSEDPRVLDLPPEVQSAFDGSDVFLMETVPDANSIIQSMMAMVYTDGRTLEGVIGNSLYGRALKALSTLGMNEEAVRDFKPWAVVTLLSVPRATTGEFLDMKLYKEAVAAGKQVVGLETIDEQLAVFDSLSEQDQVNLLRETLDAQGLLPQVFERLLTAYLDRDLAGLLRLSHQYLRGGDPRLAARFEAAALDVRNIRMTQRLEPYLRSGKCFIAVGALHLAGENGILARLLRAGYRVSPVY